MLISRAPLSGLCFTAGKRAIWKTYRERPPPILDLETRKTFWGASLLLRLVQSPYLQQRFIGEIFRDGNKQGSPLHLFHVGDGPSIVGLERSHDLEGLGQDPDLAIVAGDEEIVGARTDAAYIIALATSAFDAKGLEI